MSLKTRLVSVISAFTLVLGMLIMGVLAVSQVNVNMGGSISFTADDVYAHVTGNVTGATVPPSELNVTYSATKTTGDDTVWKKLDLNFDDSATPVVFSITVENLSTERTLTVTLTDTIASETPNLLKTITTTSGAYTSGDIITLDPQGQANDTVQFTLTLSVEDKNTSLSNASFGYDLQLFDVSVAPEPPVELTGFSFSTSDADAVTLTSYTGNEANVVIPSSFSILDGKYVEGSDYTITAIADSAFEGNLNLQSVTIPEGVTSIGEDAFSGCSALTEVNFGEDSQLASIGIRAFLGCNNLTNITIPEGVTSIGGSAFYSCSALTEVNFGADSLLTSIGAGTFQYCTNLTSITIPDRVTSIGSSAFNNCYALAEVYNYSSRTIDNTGRNGYLGYYAKEIYNASDLEGEKPDTKIDVDDNVQYYVDGATRIALAPAVPRESLTSVTLRPGTTEINQYAFNVCSNLTSIIIPKGVTSIGEIAFGSCDSLTSITIPESVTSIGYDAFSSCSALTEVNFGADSLLKSIGNRAFRFCSNLTSITIPESVISIGECAFQSCRALTEVNFGEDSQLASIGEIAFDLCYSLTSITIPKDVTSIGSNAFSECYALAEVYNYSSLTIDYNKTSNGYLGYYAQVIYNASDLKGEKPETKIENDGTMQYYVDGTTRIALLPAVPRESLISVTLHPDTTEINQHAFYKCSNLTSIIIPENVASIAYATFEGCAKLASITIPEGVISIGYSAFGSCTSLATVTIDSGDIYEDLTSNTACGRLIENATTIRVLANIIDGGSYTNSYLNGTTFSKSDTAVDGYYVFTRN